MPKFLLPKNKFLWSLLTRILGMVILLSFGGYLAQPGIWPDFPFDPPTFAVVLSALVFGAVGFFLPDLILIGTKLGFRRIVDMLAVSVSASVVKSLPKRRAAKKRKKQSFESGSILVDSSAVADLRLIKIVESGFLRGELIISKAVLTELRHLADSKDQVKRNRGRRALDDLSKLKGYKSVRLRIIDRFSEKETDKGLVEFAAKNKLPLLTIDYNLLKEAQVRGLEVLSFNNLANAIKIEAIPGDSVDVRISQSGSEKDQGVGFLADGTMVVVDKGAVYVGKTIKIEVNKAIQKDTGRIIFGSVLLTK